MQVWDDVRGDQKPETFFSGGGGGRGALLFLHTKSQQFGMVANAMFNYFILFTIKEPLYLIMVDINPNSPKSSNLNTILHTP